MFYPFPFGPPCFGLGGIEGVGLLGAGGFVRVGGGVDGGWVAFPAPVDMGEVGERVFAFLVFDVFFPFPCPYPFPLVPSPLFSPLNETCYVWQSCQM